MLVCLRRWMPDRDLVVVADGGYAKREFLLHCQGMSKPIVVVTKLRKDASLYQPRATAAAPARSGGPGWSARDCPVPRRCWTIPLPNGPPCRATGSDGSTAMVELTSGVALWYHGGQPSVHLRWVVVRHLEERRGPYALLCTDVEAEPLPILQWYMLRWQAEVAFEELRAHLGMETQRQWSERAIARTTPALFGLFSVVTLAADVLTGQQSGMAPRTTAWYDKTSPSFADAIALVRRYLWVQQGTFMTSEREHESIKVPRLCTTGCSTPSPMPLDCTKHRYARVPGRAEETNWGRCAGRVSSRRSVSSGPRPTRLWCKLPDPKHGPGVLRRHHW